MKKSTNISKIFRGSILIVALLVLWQFLSTSGLLPAYLLPRPYRSSRPLCRISSIGGSLESHLGRSGPRALLRHRLGLSLRLFNGSIGLLKDALYPLLVLTQTVPTVAIAPLLVLWMGYGMTPKVVLIVIVTFFPMAVNLYEGFASADVDEMRLLRAMGAGKREIFSYVKLPNALDGFFSALKISASYSVVGAVIAEWLGGFQGLGVYMTRVKNAYSYDRMFAVIFLISFLSLILMGLVNLFQREAMPWKQLNR